jgi:hypothetical protein
LTGGLCADCFNDARADMILALNNIRVPRAISPCRYCAAAIPGIEIDRYGKAVCGTCVGRMYNKLRSIALYDTCDEFGARRQLRQLAATANALSH